MKIQNSCLSQNFGAKYIATTKIKEKIPFTPFYRKIDVDFVELERECDFHSLKTYISNDPYNILGLQFLTNLRSPGEGQSHRAFALTRQRHGHEELEPRKIIGFCDGFYSCDWRDGNIFFISDLETQSINNKQRPIGKKLVSFLGLKFSVSEKCKGLGKAILRNIINIHAGNLDSIQLEAMPNAKSFYKHLGFKNDCLEPDYYRLSRWEFNELTKD